MKLPRLLFVSLICWPVGLAVEAVFLVLAVPANLIGLATLRGGDRPGSEGRAGNLNGVRVYFRANDYVLHFAPWLWLFDNAEDGVGGPWEGRNGNERRWCERAKHWPLWRRILSWNLLRNPVSNLRFTRWGVYVNPWFVEWIGNSPNPARSWLDRENYLSDQEIGSVAFANVWGWRSERLRLAMSGGPYWCWARQGWRSGLWIVRAGKDGRSITHRLGWAICPQPLREIDRHAGFKCQPLRRG